MRGEKPVGGRWSKIVSGQQEGNSVLREGDGKPLYKREERGRISGKKKERVGSLGCYTRLGRGGPDRMRGLFCKAGDKGDVGVVYVRPKRKNVAGRVGGPRLSLSEGKR